MKLEKKLHELESLLFFHEKMENSGMIEIIKARIENVKARLSIKKP